ncbi:DUF1465 family protein [Rhodomicrobium vannielii]|nr:DUF1465 family protein [Rhodomicrobium vannielii]
MPPRRDGTVTVPFRKKSGQPDAFLGLFREGMSLVEATANYLDGPGRRESKCLPPQIALCYATESMRLTTRLTQLATWLLARRAVMNGEPMPPSGSANDPQQLPPMTRPAGSKGFESLPQQLRDLIEAGYRLHDKVCRFDGAERGVVIVAAHRHNAVASQVAQLQAAFGQ